MHGKPSSKWGEEFMESGHALWALMGQEGTTVERRQEFPKVFAIKLRLETSACRRVGAKASSKVLDPL